MTSRTRQSRRKLAIAIVAVTTALAVTACAGSDTAPADVAAVAKEGGMLTVGIGTGLLCLDPVQSITFNSAAIERSLGDSLTAQDPETGEIKPWLLESWSVNEDATQYTLVLKDGITFSDGTPLTSTTVMKNFDLIKAAGAKSGRGRTYFNTYEGSVPIDDLTLEVNFSSPAAHFLVGTSTILMTMTSDASTELSLEDRCQAKWIGTGPFVLDEWIQDQEATVSKRDDYDWASGVAEHTGPAYLDQINFKYQPTGSVRAGALAAGETQVALSLEAQDVASTEAAGATIKNGVMPGMPAVFYPNRTNAMVSDKVFREAFAHAIDVPTIVNTVLLGYYNPARSVITSNFSGFVDHSEDFAYDPELSGELLDEAGWELEDDGFRYKDGQKLSFNVLYTEDFGAFYTSLMQLVQDAVKQVGMEMTLKQLPQAAYSEASTNLEYDLTITTITESDVDQVRSFLDTRFTPAEPTYVESIGLAAPFLAQQAATDPKDRDAIWADIQDIFFDEMVGIPLFEGAQVAAVSPEVTGLRYDVKSMSDFYDVAFIE